MKSENKAVALTNNAANGKLMTGAGREHLKRLEEEEKRKARAEAAFRKMGRWSNDLYMNCSECKEDAIAE